MTITQTTSNQLFPISLKLDYFEVLVIGGGAVALENLQQLFSFCPNTRVTLIAESVLPALAKMQNRYFRLQIVLKAFEVSDIGHRNLIIVASRNESLHQYLKVVSDERGILLNIPAAPELSNCIIGKTLLTDQENQSFGLDAGGDEFKNSYQSRYIEDSDSADKRRKKVAKYFVFAFCLMLFGHFVFSQIHLNELSAMVLNWGKTLDPMLLLVLLAGVIAQLVDGALGMGYGVTSATILSSVGVTSPAAISASIHTAEIVASGASGYSHFKFGNVNKKLFKALVIPGVFGAVLGAMLLVFVGEKYGQYMRPFVAAYTLFLGFKFIWNAFKEMKPQKKFKHYSLLAWIGGFFDSVGGGGWGPIVTSTLINNGRSHRFVVGSVSLTEFFVTLSSAFSFFIFMGLTHWKTIACLMLGSLIAAPFAAKLAGKIPKKASYILLGILVIVWSGKILFKYLI